MSAQFVSLPASWREHSVLFIKGGQQAPLFLTFLRSHLARGETTQFVTLDAEVQTLSQIKATCEMSFLGAKQIIWLKGLGALLPKAVRDIQNYLKTYQGPHTVICAVDSGKVPAAKDAVITLPQAVDKEWYARLYAMVYPGDSLDRSFVQRVYNHHKDLPVDVAFILIQYQKLIGHRSEYFMNHWLERVVPKGLSLFTLSTYFFAKNAQQFVPLWFESRGRYPDEFWVSYWSSQLWLASMFVAAKKQSPSSKNVARGSRLPFSFMQGDWRKYTTHELATAHDFLYTVDFWHKNGSVSRWVDLFCLKFVQDGFK